MITVFNRKELLITMDMDRQAEVRSILSDNAIKYKVKVTDLQNAAFFGGRRIRNGNFGIDQKFSYEYKIYVHKQDYDKAQFLIRR